MDFQGIVFLELVTRLINLPTIRNQENHKYDFVRIHCRKANESKLL